MCKITLQSSHRYRINDFLEIICCMPELKCLKVVSLSNALVTLVTHTTTDVFWCRLLADVQGLVQRSRSAGPQVYL